MTDMNPKFRRLTDGFYAAPQITPAEVTEARAAGFDLIINNRPDGEEPGQPTAAEIRAAAEEAGIACVDIPIGRDGVSHGALDAFDAAVEGKNQVLGFCRSGTRSTVVRSMAAARAGRPVEEILTEAANGGYDLSPQAPVLSSLGGK